MKQDKINLALTLFAWVIFTFIGHSYSLRIGNGAAAMQDYLLLGVTVVMFMISWLMVYIFTRKVTAGLHIP